MSCEAAYALPDGRLKLIDGHLRRISCRLGGDKNEATPFFTVQGAGGGVSSAAIKLAAAAGAVRT